jgi:hypothetical protein
LAQSLLSKTYNKQETTALAYLLKCYFSVVDVVQVLTDTINTTDYPKNGVNVTPN